MAEQRNPILVLSELGRGNAYDQATKLWLLANDPDRSPVVSWDASSNWKMGCERRRAL
jgi:hypothetical protein